VSSERRRARKSQECVGNGNSWGQKNRLRLVRGRGSGVGPGGSGRKPGAGVNVDLHHQEGVPQGISDTVDWKKGRKRSVSTGGSEREEENLEDSLSTDL